MPFEIIDLAHNHVYGPYPSHAAAHEVIDRCRFRSWAILCDGECIESTEHTANSLRDQGDCGSGS